MKYNPCHSKKDRFSRAASRDLKQSLASYKNSTLNPRLKNLSVNINQYDLKNTSKFYYPYNSRQNLEDQEPHSQFVNSANPNLPGYAMRRIQPRANVKTSPIGNQNLEESTGYGYNSRSQQQTLDSNQIKANVKSIQDTRPSKGQHKNRFWDRLKDMNDTYGSKHLEQFHRIYRSQEPKQEDKSLSVPNNLLWSNYQDPKRSVKGILHSPDPSSSYFQERDSQFMRKSNEQFFRENEQRRHRKNMREFYKRKQIMSRNAGDLQKKVQAFETKNQTMQIKRKHNQENGKTDQTMID